MKNFLLSLLFLFVFTSFLSAETGRRSRDDTSRRKSPASTGITSPPVARPPVSPRSSSPPVVRQKKVVGEFSLQGRRLLLLINRPVKKVQLYDGKRKITELRGGRKFDVTKPLSGLKSRMVRIRYHDLQKNVSSQQLTIPASFFKTQQSKQTKQAKRVTQTKRTKVKPAPPDGVSGKLIQQRSRWLLQISRPVKKVGIYEGKRRIDELAGGRRVDVTGSLAKVKGRTVMIFYHGMNGEVDSQRMVIPAAYAKKAQVNRRKKEASRSGQPNPVSAKLQKRGDRLTLQLNRTVSKVTIYDGKRKVGEVKGGRTLDVTSLMAGIKGRRLRVEYHDMKGRVSSETLTAPAPSKSTQSPLSGMTMQSLNLSGPSSSQFGPVNLTGLIEVVEPGQGDFFTAGQQYDIVWNVLEPLDTNCIQMKLHERGSGQVHVIDHQWSTRTTPGQDGYHWNVPANLAGSYQVVITTCDNSAGGVGEAFLVVSPDTDLSVQDVTVTPIDPDSNDTIRVRGRITNVGLTPAPDVSVKLTVRDPAGGEHVVFRKTLPGLGFGAHHNIEQEYRVNRKGVYENILSAEVYLHSSPETHLDNNEDSSNSDVRGMPDLVVCCDAQQFAQVGNRWQINGWVYNRGDEPSGATSVNFRIEDKGTDSTSVPPLDPSHSHQVYRSPRWFMGGNRDFHIEVDPGNAIEEIDEDDNRRDGNIFVEALFQDYDWPNMSTYYGCSDIGKGNGTVLNHPYTVTGVETAMGSPVSGSQ